MHTFNKICNEVSWKLMSLVSLSGNCLDSDSWELANTEAIPTALDERAHAEP